jgi:uncharacterized protein (TIGR00251 family)
MRSRPTRAAFVRGKVLVDTLRMIPLLEGQAGVSFAVKVQPRARKNAITGELGDALKVSLTAPPVDGRANEACVEFFANLLEVPRSSVSIASGEKSRRKVVRVRGLSADEIRKVFERSQD